MVPLYSMIRSVESVLRSSLRMMVTKAAVKTCSVGKAVRWKVLRSSRKVMVTIAK